MVNAAAVRVQPDDRQPLQQRSSSPRRISASTRTTTRRTKELILTVTGGFTISAATATRGIADNKSFQVSDDLTSCAAATSSRSARTSRTGRRCRRRGRAAAARGTSTARRPASAWPTFCWACLAARAGRRRSAWTSTSGTQGLYAQDTWRATDRITVNAGVRWEPFSGQQIDCGAITNFNHDNFRQNVKSTQCRERAGRIPLSGRSGLPHGTIRLHDAVVELRAARRRRVGCNGNGRMSLRSSYGFTYDFPVGETWFRPRAGPPFGNRTRLSDPPGASTIRIATCPAAIRIRS